MRPISDYDTYIFDCDGVILDSNQLKIDAMEKALIKFFGNDKKTNVCVDYFKKNFGTSRFHHVKYFVNQIFMLSGNERDKAYENILLNYSAQCKELYLKSNLTPGILEFIAGLNGRIYIASGSEENELREVFKERKLDKYFQGIYGSPTPKVELIASIMQKEAPKEAIMFGDAFSDMKAAADNLIDFAAYLPFSNVKHELKDESLKRGFSTLNSWSFNK
jgi:phosphoglycolate phosphatase-like HAD superfamily hydrolase